MLPSALPYLEAASTSPLRPLRRLAAEQYGSLLAANVRRHCSTASDEGGDGVVEAACLQLVRMLADADAAVAAAAAKALSTYGSSSVGALRRLLAPESLIDAALAAGAALGDLGGAVRLRVLALALELAARGADRHANGYHNPGAGGGGSDWGEAVSDERLQLLRDSGLLQPLLRQLADPSDPLACLAALQLLEDLLAGSGGDGGGDAGGVAAALAGIALPQLLMLVSEPLLADAALPLVAGILRRSLPEALPAAAGAAAIAAGSSRDLDQDRQPTPVAGLAPALAAAPELLAAVRVVLDDRGDASAAAEACGLDALGTLGQSRAGAQLVLADEALVRALCERALGRSPHTEVRLAALHAVASLAGLERAGRERARAAAILPAQCEEALRRGVFGASGLRRPGEVLLGMLQQPFLELRLAAYRCVAAVALRSWFAAETATTPELLGRLTDASSESGAAGCSWRHAAAAALHATVSAAVRGEVVAAGEEALSATLAAPAVAERVRAAVQSGPYGTDGGGTAAAAEEEASRMHEQHFVATRGGGGGM